MRAWLEIDLEAVSHNYDTVRQRIGQTGIIAVVKSDAYGHGIETMAKLLDKKGVLAFAVISLDEAIRVRRASGVPVLILGYMDDAEIEEAIACGFVLSLYDIGLAPIYESIAVKLGRKAIVHLKVETGLNRLGVQPEEAQMLLKNPQLFPHLKIESVYSHLSTSSNRDENLVQLDNLEQILLKSYEGEGRHPIHMSNSHSLGNFPEGFMSAVRLGLALYGVDEVLPNLTPSMQCKSVIIQRKKVKAGQGISYNKLFRAEKDMEVGVIGIGYAEGLSQALTGKANVLVNGRPTPILGQICMNLCVINLTDIPAERGTEVVVIGSQKAPDGTVSQIKVSDVAAAAGIRHHEILTRFGLALPRQYLNDPFASAEQPVRTFALPAEALVGA